MQKLLLAASALMLTVGVMSTTMYAQDDRVKKADTDSAKEAEAVKATVHKATIDGMK